MRGVMRPVAHRRDVVGAGIRKSRIDRSCLPTLARAPRAARGSGSVEADRNANPPVLGISEKCPITPNGHDAFSAFGVNLEMAIGRRAKPFTAIRTPLAARRRRRRGFRWCLLTRPGYPISESGSFDIAP